MANRAQQQNQLLVLYAYDNPQTKYRVYHIDTPEKAHYYHKVVFQGTFPECSRVRIAITTDLKRKIYGSPKLHDLQEVFN